MITPGISMTTIDYDAWARTYDDTRGASPSVLRALYEALGPAGGRTLLDIGGGTGNFAKALAEEGFRVVLCDYSPEMARRAFGQAARFSRFGRRRSASVFRRRLRRLRDLG